MFETGKVNFVKISASLCLRFLKDQSLFRSGKEGGRGWCGGENVFDAKISRPQPDSIHLFRVSPSIV